MNESQLIDYSELPQSAGGISKLFIDYLTQFPKVQAYYESDFHNKQQYQTFSQHVSERFQHHAELVEVLLEQNQQYGGGQKTSENIQKFGQRNTVAVVTGQQVGILTGPLYTMYKTITAIKLSEQLTSAYPEFNFVPVFWIEGEDHDFEEINSIGLLNNEHTPTNLQYLIDGKPLDKNIGAVGEFPIDHSIQMFFEQLNKTLSQSEFKNSLIDILQQTYTQGSTFSNAFARLLNAFLGDSGIVFISSNDKRFKKLLSPVFRKEIEAYPKVSQLVIQRSAELESRYHAQIKPKALNLFYFHKNGRFLIEPRESDFSLKGTRQYFQKEELLRIADETPELLSPNVALRPICQDTLLPTAVYVGGPSEIAYFAQLKPVYEFFGLKMPIIYPRASVTLFETKHEKVFEKYELELREFFGGAEKVHDKVIEIVSEVKIDEMFQEVSQRIEELVNEMKFGLNYIDPTLLGALETTRSRIEQQFEVLKGKTTEAQKRKHEVALRQVSKVSNSIFPNGNYQERELNIVYFLNKYGLDFTKKLMNEIQIDRFQHQIIKI